MKTRIVILLSFALIIAACGKEDNFFLPPPASEITLSSPDPLITYPTGTPILIKGDVSDPARITTLSIMVYRTTAGTIDTVFHKTQEVNDISASFNQAWTPLTSDFAGSTNDYLLEVKIAHDLSSSDAPSYFQDIHVKK
jgi:hypothetical protein